VIVRHATLADVDTILAMRRERAEWLRQLGQSQWQVPWPRSAVTAAVSTGQTWMLWDGEERIGTLTLSAWSETDELWRISPTKGPHWTGLGDPYDALYLSKLMIWRSRSGAGLGAELIDWASGRAYDAGVTWLRIDAWTTNTALHRYYLALGFTYVRTIDTSTSGWCAQRAAQPYTSLRLKTEI
jgi:GNAT superfamily N-acetyltransferase